MSSNTPDPSELIRFLLTQQSCHVSYQQPAPAAQVDAPNVSLEQLAEFVKDQMTPNDARARKALKAQENYNLLQSHLQSNGTQSPCYSASQPNGTAAVTQNWGSSEVQLLQCQAPQANLQLQVPGQQQNRRVELEQRAHLMLNIQWQSMNVQQLEDHLLSSIQLLTKMDPHLASVTALLATNMPTLPSSQAQGQTPRDAQHDLSQANHQSQASNPTELSSPQAANELQKNDKNQARPFSPIPQKIDTPDETTVQSWSLKQLEAHVEKLELASQPIPTHVSVALYNACRSEEKRKAKLAANLKWSTTSKAKEKKLFKDMVEDNARLKKKVIFLRNLPDLIITINKQGIITFCGDHVEMVLSHNKSDLLGQSIEQICAPESRRTLRRLIQDLGFADPKDCSTGNSSPKNNIIPTLGSQDGSDNPTLSGSSNKKRKNSKKRKGRDKGRRLVPTYKVWFVRDDLTTVRCEITASLFLPNELAKENEVERKKALEAIAKLQGNKSTNEELNMSKNEDNQEDELILCIRPIDEGRKVREDCRFTLQVSIESEITSISASSSGNNLPALVNSEEPYLSKKRHLEHQESNTSESLPRKKQALSGRNEQC